MSAEAPGAQPLSIPASAGIPKRRVVAWAFWDWSNQPFNTVIVSFVFTALYLVGDDFIAPALRDLPDSAPAKQAAIAQLTSGLGWGGAIAGILIALLAPVIGQRSDAAGSRKRFLGIATGVLAVIMLAMFFVRADPSFFALGVALVSLGNVVSEIAAVQYNAMIAQVSTPRTVGRVSGLGWGFGYVGGILALVIVVVLNSVDFFGLDTSDGLAYRLIAVGCAVWSILFALPIFLGVPESAAAPTRERVPFFQSYVVLVKDIVRIFREERRLFWFLLASAVFRDGLAGVFAFGAVIAARVYGFSDTGVILFGVAANLVAGVSTMLVGLLDDWLGPRFVILLSLGTMIVAGGVLFFARDTGQTVFWIFGLMLSAFVGPAQAAGRSLLARLAPAGREGEIFGLYATTGRAASFLTPTLWGIFIGVLGATYWGILGILIVLAIGFVLTLLVRAGRRSDLAG